MTLRTEYQKRKEQRDASLYARYKDLRRNKENSRTAIVKLLMEEFDLNSISTVYAIIHRVEGQKKRKA